MIKFFRKIRQNLLFEGKTGKYLKYAIGEIILVVVGILIALSINNWNEYKKDRQTERKILKQLVKNLETIEQEFTQTLQYDEELSKSSVIVLDVLENRLNYFDSLGYHFDRAKNKGTAFLTIPTPGYESLKNTGFDIIVDEELKNALIELFEVHYPVLETSIISDVDLDEVIENYLMANFYRNGINLVPFDYKQILEDKYFYSIINRRNEFRLYHKILIERAMFQTDSVKQLIVKNITSK